jgi:hypothetical protein
VFIKSVLEEYFICGFAFQENPSAKWLELLLRIREVPGTNLGPETGYTDSFLVVFVRPTMLMLG